MKEKLRRLLETEQIKPSLLAEQLNVNPAAISHLLAGRNKPGFELIQKLLRRFPALNPDWLLLDAPDMYRTNGPDASTDRIIQNESEVSPASRNSATAETLSKSQVHAQSEPELEFPLPPIPTKRASIEKIVIFYDDRTFDVFSPTRP